MTLNLRLLTLIGLVALCPVVWSLSGCGQSTSSSGGGDSSPTPGTSSLEAIHITSEAEYTQIGSTIKFTATAFYTGSTTSDVTSTVTWNSSKSEVGTINTSGIFTGDKNGSTEITATYQSKTSNTLKIFVGTQEGGGGGGSTGPSTFLASAMDLQGIDYIIPLGNMNPPEHTTPTNHIYFAFKDKNAVYDVLFPASGEVTVIRSQPDYKIQVKCSNSFQYYLDHVQSLEAKFVPYINNYNISGLTVSAGEKVGTTGKNSLNVAATDLGVIDTSVTLNFINLDNYRDETIHCGAPLTYYVQPLRSSLEALVNRINASDKNGKIDFDVAGELMGNWFSKNMTITDPSQQKKEDGHTFGAMQLAFVYNNTNATQQVISIGGEVFTAGIYCIQSGATPFESVTKSSGGIVSYDLYDIYTPSVKSGTLIVKYNSDDTLSVEASTGNITSFSAKAYTYTR